MIAFSFLLPAVWIVLVGLHTFSCLVAGIRLRTSAAPRAIQEPITIVVSIAGLDEFEMKAALSALPLAGETVEVIYCAYREDEPAVIALRRRLARSPVANVRVAVGRERWSRNPKLDNIEKAFGLIRSDLVVFVDGNVRLPADFVSRLLAEWDEATGAVSSPPLAADPDGFWAEVEYAMLNPLFARYQIVSDWLGLAYVHGKVFMLRRSFLAAHGGMRALDGEPIEDGAATRLVRGAGQRIRLTRRLFEQPLGRRLLADVWQRNLRWAQQRRHCYPVVFVIEPLMTAIPALGLAAAAAVLRDLSPLPAIIATAAVWYGSEAALSLSAGWLWRPRSVVVAMVRDGMAIGVWCTAWLRTRYVWRGQPVDLSKAPTT